MHLNTPQKRIRQATSIARFVCKHLYIYIFGNINFSLNLIQTPNPHPHAFTNNIPLLRAQTHTHKSDTYSVGRIHCPGAHGKWSVNSTYKKKPRRWFSMLIRDAIALNHTARCIVWMWNPHHSISFWMSLFFEIIMRISSWCIPIIRFPHIYIYIF